MSWGERAAEQHEKDQPSEPLGVPVNRLPARCLEKHPSSAFQCWKSKGHDGNHETSSAVEWTRS